MTISASGTVGIGTGNPATSLDLSAKTDSIRLPAGTTGQRPAASVNGDLRYNSTLGKIEGYISGAWASLNGRATHIVISSTPYTITSAQESIYFTYNNAANGTINLPTISGLPDGFQITIVCQVPQNLTLVTSGADTFDFGEATFDMGFGSSSRAGSVTLTLLGSKWSVTGYVPHFFPE